MSAAVKKMSKSKEEMVKPTIPTSPSNPAHSTYSTMVLNAVAFAASALFAISGMNGFAIGCGLLSAFLLSRILFGYLSPWQ